MKLRVRVNPWLLMAITVGICLIPALALAEPPNIGGNLAGWLYKNITPWFGVGCALAGVWFLIKKQFAEFIGFMVFALVIALLVFFPDNLKDLAQKIYDGIL